MLIFYFTATGNSLSVAKRIGGELLSIPQIIDRPELDFKDDAIGLVFPIYGYGPPKMVKRFLEKATWAAEYAFAIGTYGNKPGAAMENMQNGTRRCQRPFDYAESLLMVDNYLPYYDTKDQIAKLGEKRTEENLVRIVEEVKARRPRWAVATQSQRADTMFVQSRRRPFLDGNKAKSYLVDETCDRCGVCAKVCPAHNIEVAHDGISFLERCEFCLACVHLCPQRALRLRREKGRARFMNPEVTLDEIIEANNRTNNQTNLAPT
jgi:ferredoxin